MSRNSSQVPLPLHAKLSRALQDEGRKAFSERSGVSTWTIERAMAFAPISPMALRLITAALETKPAPKETRP